jgi:alpha-tubulin suppressor-like RCC1 family protein
MTPCQQVITGLSFTVALTRSGELYSWGRNLRGQLGHGHTHNESMPWEVIVQSNDGAPDLVVQVSTSRILSTSCILNRGLCWRIRWGWYMICNRWGTVIFYTAIHSLYMVAYTLYRDSKVWGGIYKVQVSATVDHVAAVTKAGWLFTWGSGLYDCLGYNSNSGKELRPKRVEHGGFSNLFVVCVCAGHYCSAAIDSSGLVPIPLFFSTILDTATLEFILNPCYYGPFDMTQLILWGI